MAAFAARGRDVPLDLARRAFLAEVAYYREHSLEGADPPRLADLRRRCARILAEVVETAQQRPLGLSQDELVAVLLESLHFRLLPGAVECLAALAARHIPLAVVSNWDCSLPEILAQVGLTDGWVSVTSSAVVGCEKPDPRTWDGAVAALGQPRERIWHVGDEPAADVAGALAAGLRPVLVGPAPAPPGVPRIASLAELPALVLNGRDPS